MVSICFSMRLSSLGFWATVPVANCAFLWRRSARFFFTRVVDPGCLMSRLTFWGMPQTPRICGALWFSTS